MTSTERHAHRRRRRIIAAALVTTTLTACAQDPPKPKALTAGSLDDRDFTRLRAAGGPHVVTPKPRRRRQRAHIGTAVTVRIPDVWARLVQCEASGHWDYGKPGGYTDPGYSEYEGGMNFVHSTWLAHGGGQYAAHAYDATPAEQIVVAKRTLRSEGIGAWPQCGPRVGLSLSDAA